MTDITSSIPDTLPSTRTLVRSTILAASIAAMLLVTVVLPAEYGIDPTGIGGVLGLTQMGKIKASLESEAVAEAAAASTSPPAATPVAPATPAVVAPAEPSAAAAQPRKNSVTIELVPNQGREIKLFMSEGARVTYSWSTDQGVVNYDQHADSKEPPRPYHGYKKGSGVKSDEGELVAAFEGWHGWFWRNRGTATVRVTVTVSGDYSEIKEMK